MSVGFIGSGRLAERVARGLVQRVAPRQRFCYRKQRLVASLLAADPSRERRQVFATLGFATTDANQRVLADCDVVFLGTSAPEALAAHAAAKNAAAATTQQQQQQTLFVSLMGDLPAKQLESLLWPGAKVIRLMPHNYLEQLGLPKGVLPPASWAAVRGSHASAEDVQRVLALAGISSHVEVAESAREPHSDITDGDGVLHRIVRSINEQRALVAKAAFDAAAAASSAGDATSVTAEFADTYATGEVLGKGQFSQVLMATHKRSGEPFAVKCLRDDRLTKEGREMLVAEVGALTRLSHPHIISHHGFFSEGDSYYLVLDYCAGGGLERVLRERQSLPEAQAKQVIRQVLSALEYSHSMGQIHRDVKAENVLLVQPLDAATPASEIHVKLADFGLSEELELASGRLQQICGTPQYLSPELVSGRGYGKPADIWAAGILSYMLLSGRVPFDGARSEQDLNKLIALGAIWYSPRDWDAVSGAAKDLVQRMLEVSPDARATASELLAHEWLRE